MALQYCGNDSCLLCSRSFPVWYLHPRSCCNEILPKAIVQYFFTTFEKKRLALFIRFGYDSHRVRDVQLCPRHCLSWPSQWVPRSIRGRFVCLRRSWGRGWWRPRRRLRRPRTRPARSCPWYFSEGPCGPADGSRQGLIAIAQDAIRHTNKKHCHWFDCTLNHIVNFK